MNKESLERILELIAEDFNESLEDIENMHIGIQLVPTFWFTDINEETQELIFNVRYKINQTK